MAKLKGLGRGLDALLGGEDNAAPPQGDLRMMKVTQLAPGQIPAAQPDGQRIAAGTGRFDPCAGADAADSGA